MPFFARSKIRVTQNNCLRLLLVVVIKVVLVVSLVVMPVKFVVFVTPDGVLVVTFGVVASVGVAPSVGVAASVVGDDDIVVLTVVPVEVVGVVGAPVVISSKTTQLEYTMSVLNADFQTVETQVFTCRKWSYLTHFWTLVRS